MDLYNFKILCVFYKIMLSENIIYIITKSSLFSISNWIIDSESGKNFIIITIYIWYATVGLNINKINNKLFFKRRSLFIYYQDNFFYLKTYQIRKNIFNVIISTLMITKNKI